VPGAPDAWSAAYLELPGRWRRSHGTVRETCDFDSQPPATTGRGHADRDDGLHLMAGCNDPAPSAAIHNRTAGAEPPRRPRSYCRTPCFPGHPLTAQRAGSTVVWSAHFELAGCASPMGTTSPWSLRRTGTVPVRVIAMLVARGRGLSALWLVGARPLVRLAGLLAVVRSGICVSFRSWRVHPSMQ
jgi:hypothetical protein